MGMSGSCSTLEVSHAVVGEVEGPNYYEGLGALRGRFRSF